MQAVFKIFKKACFKFGLVLLFTCWYGTLAAQQYNFREYSIREGLTQSEVTCVFQDSRGYLWIGTSGGGLCKFDGNQFVSYEAENGLAGQIITDIHEDKKGNLWISSTWGGISMFDGKKFIQYNSTRGLTDGYTSCVGVKKNGTILVGTSNGLVFFDENRFKKVSQIETKKLLITKILEDDSENVWVSTNHGLYIYKNNKLMKPELGTNEAIKSMSLDKKNQLIYLLNSGELFRQSIGKDGSLSKAENITPVIPQLNDDQFISVYIDTFGRMWLVASGSGLVCVQSNGNVNLYNTENGMPTNRILCVFQDKTGYIWLGSKGNGLLKFKDNAFSYFDGFKGLSSGEVFAIQPDSSGNLWLGDYSRGLLKYDGKKVTEYNEDPLLHRFIVRSIILLRNKKVLIGGARGIRIFDGKNFSLLPGIPDNPRISASCLYEDKNGDIWIGTYGQGLFLYKNGKLRNISNTIGGRPFNIFTICETKNNLLIGTGDGVYKVSNEGLKEHVLRADLCNMYIGSMVKDHIGRVWIGTDRCISVWDGKKLKNFNTKDGFSSVTVYSLLCDKMGDIWVGTNKGIDKVSFDRDGGILNIKNYGFNDGFIGVECNSRAVTMDGKGDLYFGTIKGVIKFSPELELASIPTENQVRIENIKVDFKDISDTTKEYYNYWYRLPFNPIISYNTERMSFSFRYINPAAPEKARYSFILEGNNNNWSPWVTNNSASYSNLIPGSYIFKVRMLDVNNKVSKIVQYPFEVKGPFYQETWFMLSFVIAVGGSVLTINKYRKVKRKRDREILEKIITERTREIQKQNEEKEVLIKEIHHRVKNNLQVINSLINIQASYIEDEAALKVFEECKNRIRSISLIHEKLYKSNDFKKINLNNYLVFLIKDLVKAYNVDKEIEIKTDLQVEFFNLNTLVPLGLLLNEIISNSLKYAFTEIEKGMLTISLKSTSYNNYEMIIGDNGKGYKGDPNHPDKVTLGLELIKILSEQLDGSITKLDTSGTVYQLQFKLQKN